MTQLLQLVIQQGTGQAAALDGFAAGKTGTSQNFRDDWFLGFTEPLDDGDGLPTGFDPELSASGLGMKVVNVLASQLGGRITAILNPVGRGCCFTVAFPG